MNKESAFKDILKNLREENLAIFAGAGLSAGAGGVNWSELLEPIAEDLELDIDLETDLVELAQYHVNESGGQRGKINQLVVEKFSSDLEVSENHQILSRLPISTYWTTNYDNLIEKSLDKEGKKPDVKHEKLQLATTKPNRDALVYKMHGDVEHSSKAVITRDDYEEYYIKMEPFLSALAGDLVSKTFLFIGFSFKDPNLDYILSRVRNAYQEDQRQHYYFMRKIKKDEYNSDAEYEYTKRKQDYFIKDLKRFSIEAILIDEFEEITGFLLRLEKELNRDTVFISGSAHEYGTWGRDRSEDFISDLSKNILDNGFKIVSGYGLGVGSAVISGALKTIYKKGENIPQDSLILRPFPQNERDEKHWTNYRKDMINHSGIAIFILGNKFAEGELKPANGVWEEFQIAKDKELQIIPVGASGYVAKEIHDKVIENFEEYYPNYTDELFNLMKQLGDEEKSPDNIKETLMKVLNIVKQ